MLARWLFSTNHKDIGLLYLLLALFSGLIGTSLSILMRSELALSGRGLLIVFAVKIMIVLSLVLLVHGFNYSSGNQPREMVWVTGVLILLAMIVTAFIGYVLPWGQMRFGQLDAGHFGSLASPKALHLFADAGKLADLGTAFGHFMLVDALGNVVHEGSVTDVAERGSSVARIDRLAVQAGLAWAMGQGLRVTDIWFNGSVIAKFLRDHHADVVQHKGTQTSTFVGIEICDTEVRISKMLAKGDAGRLAQERWLLARLRRLSPFMAYVAKIK